MDIQKESYDIGIDKEIEWGTHYRQQKKQARRSSMVPTTSPLNIQHMWERYQVTKEVLELERLKLEMPPPRPVPKFLKSTKTIKVDRAGFTKKQYIDYLATPHQYHVPKEPTLDDKAKHLRRKLKKREACSPRLVEIAKPTKVRVLGTWVDYRDRLSLDFIMRLDELLRTDHTLDPKFARCCFKELDRKDRLKRIKLRKKRKRELKKKKIESQKWLKMQIETTAQLIADFFEKEPLLTLNFKQMLLSTVILTELYNKGDIKFKPVRNPTKPYHQTIVDIVDQLAVWMDTIFRYVDVQYTESIEDFLEVPSLESMLGEEEEEEEDGEDGGPKRFKLPPLPPLPPMAEDLKPLSCEEGEGTGGGYPMTVFKIDEVTDEDESETSASVSGVGGEAGDRDSYVGSVGGGGGGSAEMDDDMLQLLINILSISSPETLQELVDSEKLPDITYEYILNRIKTLKDREQVRRKQEHKALLEETLISWAQSNDPDRVNDQVINKIHDAAGILAESLFRGGAGGAGGVGGIPDSSFASAVSQSQGASGTDVTIEMGQAEDISDRALDTLPEEDTNITEDDVSDITSASEKQEDTEAPSELDESEMSDLTSVVEKEELAELQGLVEGDEVSVPSAWVIKPTQSQSKLIPGVGEPEDESATIGGISIDMTGELNVVMEEAPGGQISEMGIPSSEIGEETEIFTKSVVSEVSKEISVGGRPGEKELMGGIPRDDIPGMIPGHQPSHVFEHAPDTICCLTLKVYATWLLEVANNAHAWSRWLNDIIGEIRHIASTIRGEVKDVSGKPVMFYKEDWIRFSEKVERMIVSWRQYSMHVKDLTDKIIPKFSGKKISCCPRCMHDNLITDVSTAHDISEQLAEALTTTQYWRRWLDDIIMETRRLTTATVPEYPSDTSSYGSLDVELVELHEPRPSVSEESLYEIEEIDGSFSNY